LLESVTGKKPPAKQRDKKSVVTSNQWKVQVWRGFTL
jgi:hypothetical protein